MEIDEDTPDRVSISFPLGLALLVALLLFISCFICCCLHWDKLQSLLQSYGFIINDLHAQQIQEHFTSSSPKPGYPVLKIQRNHVSSLPVLMPGDEVPRFIALACPCQPPIMDERIIVHVHKGDFCS